MNWIFKNKNKSNKTLMVVLFLVFGFGIFLSSSSNLKAAITPEQQAALDKAKTTNLSIDDNLPVLNPNDKTAQGKSTIVPGKNVKDVLPSDYVNQGDPDDIFTKAIKWILTQVQSVVGWLFSIAATLFAWAIDPGNISGPKGLLNKPAVMDVWRMVRDLLNMTFILILLFAAFCTIFQVDKWNLKKVWLGILINALLVNFSFPIARFFIDVSNVAFYYFVNNLFSSTTTVTGSGIFAMFGSSSSLSKILQPSGFSSDTIAYQIAMIVLTFILGMTLVVVAALFVVRLVALTMLVMFSPVGFVGYIFPATEGYANKWWTQLFSYSFFAPIMIFIMAISLRIMDALKLDNMGNMLNSASANAPGQQTTWIASVAFFVIPVIVLWMGMGVAKSFGIAGADTVVSSVKKGGKWLANSPGHYSGINGGVKKGWGDMRKSGSFLGMNNWATRLAFKSGVEEREARFAGVMTDGPKGWSKAAQKKRSEENKKKIEDGAKGHMDGGASADSLAIDMNGHFGNPLPNTSKAKLDQAQLAAAYLKQDGDERKAHIQNTLQAGLVGSDLDNIINAAPPAGVAGSKLAAYVAHQAAAQAAAANIHAAHLAHAGGVPLNINMADVNQVASFTNKQMKARVELGSKA